MLSACVQLAGHRDSLVGASSSPASGSLLDPLQAHGEKDRREPSHEVVGGAGQQVW
jgi:hypothetical protein